MNSYEVVKRAIEFETPDRLPIESDHFGCDTYGVGWNQIGPGDRSLKESYDEWGCLWVRTEQPNMGQIQVHPLASWEMYDAFRWPAPDNPGLYEGMEKKLRNSEGKYIFTSIFMLLFERMHSLRGFENTLTDLYLERENIENLADGIVDYDIAIIKNIARRFPGQIHGLLFTDDWGSELATFISPALWDEFFKPRYKKIFDVAKKAGWHLWMHSCGKVNDIVGSLIDIGVDVLNLQQPRTLGIEEIGRRFAGKVCFSTLCDIQATLPFKGEQDIIDEARLLIDCWGTEKGGLILSAKGDGNKLGIPDDKVRIMFDTFMKYDRWKK